MKVNLTPYFLPLLLCFAWSCKTYRSNIMLQVEDFQNDPAVAEEMQKAEKNYVLKINDKITLVVETNGGEALIDPNLQMQRELSGNINQNQQTREPIEYLIDIDGKANLPMVGRVKLEGYTLREVDSLLSIQYLQFYEKPFVKTGISNRRVSVFVGQTAKVVPLNNESMTVLEVLALAGGLNDDTKVSDIRLIRGPLDNPYVEVMDLSTVQGMQMASGLVKANDIIYIEPVRRVANEAIRDVAPILSFATSLLAITLVIINL